MADGGAMWIAGNWGQASPWSRDTGVKMVKGENDVYTGELSLPKGTKFDIKILKSTVSTTSGGDNAWSAVRYSSTLNLSSSHDFGEFTDNLIPNSDFEEGPVKWTPTSAILKRNFSQSGNYLLGGQDVKCASDVFVLPPNQPLRLSGYIQNWPRSGISNVTVESVEPQRRTLLKLDLVPDVLNHWKQFSGSFKSSDTPTKCRIVIITTGADGTNFDTLSLVSP